MALMKLEGEIVVSTVITAGTFAGSVVTIPVGNYFLSSTGDGGASASLTATFKSQLDSATGRTWTVTLDDNSDTSTGKITLTVDGAATTATWSNLTFRNLLGFNANLSSGNTWTGANQAKYLFLPNCGRSGIMSPEASNGVIEADYTLSVASDGTLYGLAYNKRYLDSLEWRTLLGSKVWVSKAVTTNEGLEQFYIDVISLGLRVRFHADRSVDATFRTWVVEDAQGFKPVPVLENWADGAASIWAIRYIVRKTT